MKPKKCLLSLAMRIKQLRTELNFSQIDVAIFLDIEQSAYQRKEAGITRFKREELELLAELFHTPIWEFFWNEEDRSAFTSFAKQKGFIPKESIEKELESLQAKVQSLKDELSHTKKINEKLEKDKEFLRELFQIRNKKTIVRGRVTTISH